MPTRRKPLVLRTERLELVQPGGQGAGEVMRYYRDNRDHLRPWEPRRPRDFYTLGFWRRRLEMDLLDLAEDRALRLFARFPGRSEVIASVDFGNIIRGAFQACYLGYSLDRRHEGHGYMTEALRVAIDHVFDEMSLHRIMANYVPTNERSARVLKRLGFVAEGYARDYLFIDGRWTDHVLTALTYSAPPRWVEPES